MLRYFDDYGIPHIYAENQKDVMTTLGYVHAQDRLFQMEMLRRLSRGELAAILEIEGIRDGLVIRRVRRDDTAPPAAPSGGKGDVIRINTLDLRITVDDPEHLVWTVRFFDWPAGGVSPGNVAFQAAARDAERWFALLQDAMTAGASKA
jgi:hypothetical protein